ncbi:hypothetical protein V8G54_014986 [Vigna mungo]|uniref:Uncharacterized protein n=1 Tax=Vigna mungo TaxID=3915 RepID=A0AAQ3RZS1_VIGMU
MDHSNKETSKSKLKIGKIKTRHKFNTARQMHSLFYILKTTAVENIVQFNRLAVNQKALVSCNFFFTRMVRQRILPAHVDRPYQASTRMRDGERMLRRSSAAAMLRSGGGNGRSLSRSTRSTA